MIRKAFNLENVREKLCCLKPREPEFHQAVYEVARSLIPYIRKNPRYSEARIILDKPNIPTKQGLCVQFNNAIGPYGENLVCWN